MTPAEQMAERLENMTPFIDGDEGNIYNAASMIRRLSAALLYAYGDLSDPLRKLLIERHADALRDVGVKV